MAKGSVTQVAVTDTFQAWLNKTNELVTLIKNDVVTASAGAGDSTVGNAILVGNFTANNLTANANSGVVSGFTGRFSEIRQQTGNTNAISIVDPLSLTTSNSFPIRLSSSAGPRIRFNNGQRNWDIGHAGSGANSSIIFTWDDSVLASITTVGYLELLGGITANGNVNIGSGFLRAGSGSGITPGIGFSSEPGSGIFLASSNNVGIAAGGSTRAVFSNTQILLTQPIREVNGSETIPSFSFQSATTTGFYLNSGELTATVGGSRVLSIAKGTTVNNLYLYPITGQNAFSIGVRGGYLDLNTDDSNGIRIGRAALTSRTQYLKPNTTVLFVNIHANDDPAANGGIIQVSQPTNLSLPAFGFMGDTGTGVGRSATNTVSLYSAGSPQLSANASSITIKAGIGIRLNEYVAPDHRGNVSGHIGLYGTLYGLGITAASLNFAAPANAAFRFVSNVNGDIAAEIYNNNGNSVFRLSGSGSLANPTISFTDDTDTGIWRPGPNVMGISIGGADRVRFGTISQFFGTVQANSFNLINVGTGGGFLGVAEDTAENPSFTWSSDIDTGMWRIANNTIGLATAGINRAIINGGGITLENSGRFIASNRGEPGAPDFCFTNAGDFGMWTSGGYLRFSAGTEVAAISPALDISYSTFTRVNSLRFNDNTSGGFGASASFVFGFMGDAVSHRFDGNAGNAFSIMTRQLGDDRYQRTSSIRFKDNLKEINSDLESRLLSAFDLFDVKTWTWGKEISKLDERYGTEGIGFVVEELEEFLPEAVRYQWVEDDDQDPNSDKLPSSKQPHALDESPIIASLILKIRQLEARLSVLEK